MTGRLVTIDGGFDARHLSLIDYTRSDVLKQIKLATYPTSMTLSPRGDRVAISTGDVQGEEDEKFGSVLIYSSDSLGIVSTIDTGYAYHVAFSQDGAYLAAAIDKDNAVKLYNAAVLDQVAIGRRHTLTVNTLTFSPSSLHLISGAVDSTAIVWSVPTLAKVRELKGHMDALYCIGFISEHVAVTGSGDRSVRVWDTTTGQCEKTIREHSDFVNAMAISPNRAILATGSDDKTVKIYHAPAYTCELTLECANCVTFLTFASDNLLLVGVLKNDLVAYDVTTGSLIKNLPRHASLTGVAVTSMVWYGMVWFCRVINMALYSLY